MDRDYLPTVENGTPEPGVHSQDRIDMPQASVFVISLFIRPQRQLVVHKDEKGDPPMKLNGKIKSRESHRHRFLST